ncbi:MAG TPA: transporter [Epsilonproteobacteria bacterium]|nr:transporter [Campylobacterota bacterium]
MKNKTLVMSLISAIVLTTSIQAEDVDLAQELTNPIADLMTIPIQATHDQNIGSNEEGTKTQTNIQPVIPFDISDDWLLLSRTILPVIQQDEIYPSAGSQSGLGDTSVSLFFSPKKSDGIIWGAGPIILLPTATGSLLGGKKWGVGPAGIVVSMIGNWTVGGLANHVWSVAGDSNRADISNTFVQPFVAYTWPNKWGVSLQSETNYNWMDEELSVPVNLAVSKLVFFGKLPVSLQAGTGYWVKSATNGPDGVRFRVQANFVLPKF